MKLNMEKISDQPLTVVDKTDRFAVIESTGGSYKVTTTKDNEATTETVATDGIYLFEENERQQLENLHVLSR